MDYFPLFLDLRAQPCLLVGGGEVALRKAQLLLAAGGHLTVVAPALCEGLAALREQNRLVHRARRWQPDDLQGMRLAIAATDDTAINADVHHHCEAAGILVNVVDDPARCRFITPSIVDRSPLMIAISSGGNAPVLARLIRARIEAWLPHGYGALAQLAGRLRDRVKARFGHDDRARRRFWEQALDGP
ncbi:precorrin-2 dehydrogenase/sirohydrochlorin ferrochelatase family protein, partial [Chitiniphilus eburneus]